MNDNHNKDNFPIPYTNNTEIGLSVTPPTPAPVTSSNEYHSDDSLDTSTRSHEDTEDDEEDNFTDYDLSNSLAQISMSEEGDQDLSLTSDMMMHSYESQQREKANPWVDDVKGKDTGLMIDYADIDHHVHLAQETAEDILGFEAIKDQQEGAALARAVAADGRDGEVEGAERASPVTDALEAINAELGRKKLGNVYELLARHAAAPSPREQTAGQQGDNEDEQGRELERMRFMQCKFLYVYT